MKNEKMTAIGINEPGGPNVLEPREIAVPEAGSGEYLVKVHAAGVNRPDVLQRTGAYPPPKGASEIPGLEIAGEVVTGGPGTQRFKAGDAVCALVTGGGYAEYCMCARSGDPPGSRRAEHDRSGCGAGNLLHRLAQCV